VVCALSGGADSTALVALAVAAGCVTRAVHVHHGLRDRADDDAANAERVGAQLGVDVAVRHVEVGAGPNLEARARAARRRALPEDVLTGHTLDDQAESVLLALLRGAGATGLSAMTPGVTKPILALRRRETEAVCRALGLVWAVDETNADARFRRNRVRHDVLPLLDEIAERDVAPLLDRTASLLRDDDALLDELASTLDPTDVRALAAAPVPLARRALRRWLAIDGYPPSAAVIERVLAVVGGDVRACEIGGGRRVERRRGRLTVVDGPLASAQTAR
jgi:tRNA(Ile)-lysidine synthase